MVRTNIKNWAINIDKLRVCLNITDDIYTYLAEHYTRIEQVKKGDGTEKTIRFLEEDDFTLVFTDEEETKMTANLNVPDGEGGYFKLGEFVFNSGKKYKNKAFFSFENGALYRIFTKDYEGEPHGYISCLTYVAEFYGMEFNNLTELELAFDSDFNFVDKIRKMIKNVDKYDLYLNGRKVGEDEILSGYGEYYSRNRLKLQLPTLYFSQAKNSDMQMKVYDKTTELKQSTPYKEERYKEWLDWKNSDTIYRVEITYHNTNVRDFFARYSDVLHEEMGGHDNVLSLLSMSKFRMMMFYDACDRLVYFKNKKTGKDISLLELASI